MFIQKYNLQIIREYKDENTPYGSYHYLLNLITLKRNMTKDQAKITIAHELAHFFYRYELDNQSERITTRYNSIDARDEGAKISEMISHIVGFYGAEIQAITNEIYEVLGQ